MPTTAPATFGCRLPYPRPYVALAFQAFKRRVHGADGNFTPGARFNLTSDRGAVSVTTEPQQCEENELLEFAERRCHETHIVHNVDDISSTALDRGRTRELLLSESPGPNEAPYAAVQRPHAAGSTGNPERLRGSSVHEPRHPEVFSHGYDRKYHDQGIARRASVATRI